MQRAGREEQARPGRLRVAAVWLCVSVAFGAPGGPRMAGAQTAAPKNTGPVVTASSRVVRVTLAPAAEWSTYHGDPSLRGVASGGLGDPAKLHRLWRFRAGTSVSVPPVVGDGRVYFVTGDGSAGAVDLKGTRIWLVKPVPPSAPVKASPAAGVAKDALPAAANAKGATAQLESLVAPPLYAQGLVVVGGTSGTLYGLDAATGAQHWAVPLGGGIQGAPNALGAPGTADAAVIAVTQPDGVVHAVSLLDGRALWSSRPTNRTDGSPAVGSGAIAYGNCDAALHVFDESGGVFRLSIPLGENAQIAGGVAVADGQVFAGNRSGNAVCADILTGGLVWTAELSPTEVFTTPAVDRERVVLGAKDGTVYALSRDKGQVLWRFAAGTEAGSCAIAGEHVVVTAAGKLFVLQAKDGTKVWSADVSDEITSPAVAGGRILVGTGEGDIVAFGTGE